MSTSFEELSVNDYRYIFLDCCRSGDIDRVKHLYTSYLAKYPRDAKCNNMGIVYAFTRSKLNVMQWLYSVQPRLIDHAKQIFMEMTYKKNINAETNDIILWLYSVALHDEYHEDNMLNDPVFEYMCKCNELNLAMQFYNLYGTTINLHSKINAFSYACTHNHVEIAQWICQIDPYLYSLTVENNEIVHYYFVPIEKLEIFMARIKLLLVCNKYDNISKLPFDLIRYVCEYM